ncbi:MAG: DUF4960 domain-containing protein, partial [Muribaculaceae bacterium]|nr:DUF4960 domain-containing protein [Muribaculaceae bacterium]
MKKIALYSLVLILSALCATLGACSDFEPTGYTETPDLARATDLSATVDGLSINLSWGLPAGRDIEAVLVYTNGNLSNPVRLACDARSYAVKGQAMEEEYMYTVKLLYAGGYLSEGVSTTVTLPRVELANVSGLTASVDGRTVTLGWTLPKASGITGVKVYADGNVDAATLIQGQPTGCVLKGQPMDREVTYTVAVVYEEYYASAGTSVKAAIPYITPKMGYLMTAATIQQLPDDDERAAAAWFVAQDNAELITPEQLAELDADIYPVLWIEIDRVGLPLGWENLPQEFVNETTLEALRNYSANGGSLYLSNMATQLTVPLGIVPADMAPTVY